MSKTYQKEKSKQSRFLVFQKQSRFLVFQKQSRFSVFQKQSRFLVFQKHQIKHIKVLSIFQSNYVKKNYRKKVDFSSIKIRSKKVPRKDIAISYAEIMSKNVRQIGVNYWPIEITSKKYFVWKFINIFCEVLTCYQQPVNVNLMRCGVHWVWKKEKIL